jgi:hypothetical protein
MESTLGQTARIVNIAAVPFVVVTALLIVQEHLVDQLDP